MLAEVVCWPGLQVSCTLREPGRKSCPQPRIDAMSPLEAQRPPPPAAGQPMLDRVISFLKNLPAPDSGRRVHAADELHVAAAALMFHVVNADGVLEESEKAELRSALSEAYSVAGGELDSLLAAGERAEREAIDLYAFTRVLKRDLDADARLQFIAVLWTLAYADGRADELEDNIVWRVAELIGVDSRDRVAARQRIKATIAGAADGPGVE
jgi:uncharacterized tellurite resistance protein B-like protein